MENQQNIKCPVCKSTQITTTTENKANIGGAITGGLIAGGAGAIIGGTTGNNKTKLLCMQCGATFTPQERREMELDNSINQKMKSGAPLTAQEKHRQTETVIKVVVFIIVFIVFFAMCH